MKKKITSFIISAALVLAMPLTAFAGTSSNIISGKTVSTTCNAQSTWHTIAGPSGSYPAGSARMYYTYNGQALNKSVAGTSYSSYWSGTGSISQGRCYKARTTYKGSNVDAAF